MTIGSAASVVGSSGNLTITGTSAITPTQSLTFSSTVTLYNAAVTFNVGAPITFAGVTTLSGISQVTNSDTSGVHFNGQVIDAAPPLGPIESARDGHDVLDQCHYPTGVATATVTTASGYASARPLRLRPHRTGWRQGYGERDLQ